MHFFYHKEGREKHTFGKILLSKGSALINFLDLYLFIGMFMRSPLENCSVHFKLALICQKYLDSILFALKMKFFLQCKNALN
jgi:hypothetical protein